MLCCGQLSLARISINLVIALTFLPKMVNNALFLHLFTKISNYFVQNMFLVSVLLEFKAGITDSRGVLLDWDKSLTCNDGWNGVSCDSSSRVTQMYVFSEKYQTTMIN